MSDVDPEECAAAYRALRERVAALVRAADPAALDHLAPATPEWRVRDVLAHVVGVNTDILTGTLDGVATDEWTAAQVAARNDRSIDDLLGEWEESGSAVETNATLLGPAVGQWVYDACTHEHDIRHALGTPGARDSDAVAIAFAWGTDRLGEVLDHRMQAGLTLHADGATKDVGAHTPRTGVRTSRFEVVRAMSGRRSRAQVEAYGWDGPPRPEHLVLGIFTLRAADLVE